MNCFPPCSPCRIPINPLHQRGLYQLSIEEEPFTRLKEISTTLEIPLSLC